MKYQHRQSMLFASFKKLVVLPKSAIVLCSFWLLLGCSAEESNMSGNSNSALFNVTWEKGQPSIEEIQRQYGFKQGEIDSQYGVIEIDPEDNLYTVKVNSDAAARVYKKAGQTLSSPEGVYSDPKIEPFNLK